MLLGLGDDANQFPDAKVSTRVLWLETVARTTVGSASCRIIAHPIDMSDMLSVLFLNVPESQLSGALVKTSD